MENQELTGIIISLLLSAFFSGTEIAFVSANKLHIELKSKAKVLPARIVSFFIKNSSYFLAILLLGNTASLVLYGIYTANLLEPWIASWLPEILRNEVNILLLQTVLSTILVLIVAEFLPKSMFLLNPDRLIMIVAIPLVPIYLIGFIPAFLSVSFSKFIIKNIFRLEYSEDKPVYRTVDLRDYIDSTLNYQDEEDEPEIDAKIFSNALLFKNVRIRDCMIPRTEIKAIEEGEPIEKLKETFVKSGHSKILVYKESIDEIEGYVHASSLFSNPVDIRSITSPIIVDCHRKTKSFTIGC